MEKGVTEFAAPREGVKDSTFSGHLRLAATFTAQVQFSWRPLCKVPPFASSVICRKNAAPVNATAPFAKGSTTCASAWTVSTIARIAGKPAKSPSPAAVAVELHSFRLLLDADARLAAAVGGAARYLADSAGMETDASLQLQSSVVAACREAFEDLTADAPQLHVTLTRFADRIEVELSHRGDDLPAVGLDAIAGFAGRAAGGSALHGIFGGVDRVQYETHDGEAITRLTKYIRELTPRI
jgi:hypothetical protein